MSHTPHPYRGARPVRWSRYRGRSGSPPRSEPVRRLRHGCWMPFSPRARSWRELGFPGGEVRKVLVSAATGTLTHRPGVPEPVGGIAGVAGQIRGSGHHRPVPHVTLRSQCVTERWPGWGCSVPWARSGSPPESARATRSTKVTHLAAAPHRHRPRPGTAPAIRRGITAVEGDSLRQLGERMGRDRSLFGKTGKGDTLGGPEVVQALELDRYYGTPELLRALRELAAGGHTRFRARYRRSRHCHRSRGYPAAVSPQWRARTDRRPGRSAV